MSAACHATVRVGGQLIYDEFYSSTTTDQFIQFDYSVGDSLVIDDGHPCIVDVYSLEATTVVPRPPPEFDWVILSTFGDTAINSFDALSANGWLRHDTNDFQVCGLAGCSAGWCGTPCSGTAEYAGFWCGGDCSGSIEYVLPAGYNRGAVTIGMSLDNEDCHGVLLVGGREIFNNYRLSDITKLEFMYEEGDSIVVQEEQTCTPSSPKQTSCACQ